MKTVDIYRVHKSGKDKWKNILELLLSMLYACKTRINNVISFPTNIYFSIKYEIYNSMSQMLKRASMLYTIIREKVQHFF